MPKTYAQWIGMIVTSIVVLGSDTDVLVAMPYGMAAGALAVFLVNLSEAKKPKQIPLSTNPGLRRIQRDRS